MKAWSIGFVIDSTIMLRVADWLGFDSVKIGTFSQESSESLTDGC